MADNTLINQASVAGGDTIATLDQGGVKHEKVLVEHLVAGVPTMTDATNPFPVSGTVAVSNPTANPETGLAKETTLGTLNTNIAKEYGTWGYNAGASGTVILTGGKRVIGITAHSTAGGTIAINGGDSFPVVALTGITITPKGNIVNPTIVLVGTDSYFIEFVS